MPKVNLKGKNPSPAEINRRVIRAAMARAGIDFDKDVARQIGMSPSYFSTKLKEGGWKIEELQRLAAILPFTVEDAVALMGIKKPLAERQEVGTWMQQTKKVPRR